MVIYFLVALSAFALLVLHTVSCTDCARVDTTSIGLLAILLLVPVAPFITKLRAGELEAEIGYRDAKKLQASAAELPAVPVEKIAEQGALTVEELVSRDPALGLAKLRMDLEQEVRRIYSSRIDQPMRRGLSLGPMVRELETAGQLPRDISAPLLDVSALANRAIHGEFVPREVAEEIATVGLRVLEALRLLEGPGQQPGT